MIISPGSLPSLKSLEDFLMNGKGASTSPRMCSTPNSLSSLGTIEEGLRLVYALTYDLSPDL